MVFEQRVMEGKLEKISEVETVKLSGRIHPTTVTHFRLHEEGIKRDLQFRGVILPDSIGHSIVVNAGTEVDPDIITNIYDKTIDRTYSTYG